MKNYFLNYFYTFIYLILVLLSYPHSSHATDPIKIENMCFDNTLIWSTINLASELSWSAEKSEGFRSQLKGVLGKAPKILPFTERFSVLIDGDWKHSAGVYFPNDADPHGHPQVRIRPQTLLERDYGSKVIFHEWIHLLHQSIAPKEDSWIREGVALISEFENFNELSPTWRAALSTPETSLISAIDPEKIDFTQNPQVSPQYGHWLQFFFYLKKACAIPNMLQWMLPDTTEILAGIPGLDQRIRKTFKELNSPTSKCQDFETVFRAFQHARFFPEYASEDGYLNISPYTVAIRKTPMVLPPYSAMAYKLDKDTQPVCEKGDETVLGQYCLRIKTE